MPHPLAKIVDPSNTNDLGTLNEDVRVANATSLSPNNDSSGYNASFEKEFEIFIRLYDEYAPILFGLILRITERELLANTALTQTFIEIWPYYELHNLPKNDNLPWMLSIASKCAFRELDNHDTKAADQKRRKLSFLIKRH